MKRHMKIHSHSPKYKCPFSTLTNCSRAFYRQDKLKEHMKSHGNIKQLKCQICDELCIDEKALEEHSKIHGDNEDNVVLYRMIETTGLLWIVFLSKYRVVLKKVIIQWTEKYYVFYSLFFRFSSRMTPPKLRIGGWGLGKDEWRKILCSKNHWRLEKVLLGHVLSGPCSLGRTSGSACRSNGCGIGWINRS